MPNNKISLQRIQEMAQEKVAPVADKISMQRHVAAVKNGLMFTIPLTILGGFSQIISQPPVDPKIIHPTNFFNNFLLAWKTWATANSTLLAIPYNMTMGMLGLFAVVAIAYNLAKSYDMNPMSESLTSLLTFLVVCSPAVSALKDKPSALFLSTDYLGAKGLFTAIIIGLLTVEITRFLFRKNIKVRMPDSVPPMVSAPFESLIPMIVNVLLFMSVNQLTLSLTGKNIAQSIMNLFAPLVSASDSLGAIIMIALLINILWFFGIHGGAVVNAIVLPFTTLNVVENAQAVAAGQAAKHILAGGYFYQLVNIGGSGAALGMAIAILIVAKSAQLKAIAKIGIVPVAFGISEPFVFGVPMIMNPYLLIPMICVPLLNALLAYFSSVLNIIGRVYVNVPFTVPAPIAVFLSTMDWKAVVLCFVLIAIDIIIYIPFVKAYDGTLVKQESKIIENKEDDVRDAKKA